MFQVNCLWSDWSKTGGCTKSCGGGTQFFEKTRIVKDVIDLRTVKSQNRGQSCIGSSIKRENCNDHDCPAPGT